MKNRILKFELIRDKMIMVKMGILEPFKVAPSCPKNGISIGRPKYHVTEDQFSRVKERKARDNEVDIALLVLLTKIDRSR